MKYNSMFQYKLLPCIRYVVNYLHYGMYGCDSLNITCSANLTQHCLQSFNSLKTFLCTKLPSLFMYIMNKLKNYWTFAKILTESYKITSYHRKHLLVFIIPPESHG